MSSIETLVQRIDAEFSALESRIKSQQAEQIQEYEGRKQRLGELEHIFLRLREVWKPRLDALAEKFGDKVKVTPHVTPSTRDATFKFTSNLARIELRFSATTDEDVRHVILNYDLSILPILMNFESHSELSLPLDKVDAQRAGDWIDDRIVAFVKTYLALHENSYYLKDVLVSDPVANVSFPKFAAAAKLDYEGKTYYFIGQETLREFAAQKGIAAK